MSTGLRELKKRRTRAAIQEAALVLIERQGYERTTCEQIAAAAEVSPATFFRYFPTKEDVVLTDDYDPAIEAAIRARPLREGPLLAARRGIGAVFGQIGEDEMAVVRTRTRLLLSVPALRARVREQLDGARGALASAVAPRLSQDADSLVVQALAAAMAAALGVAVEHWAAHGGDLAEHVDQAFRALEDR